jgi:hypothetical protein
MADTKIALTEAAIAALPTPPKGKNRIYRFADMPGLAIRVTGNGRRHFLCCRINRSIISPTWCCARRW